MPEVDLDAAIEHLSQTVLRRMEERKQLLEAVKFAFNGLGQLPDTHPIKQRLHDAIVFTEND